MQKVIPQAPRDSRFTLVENNNASNVTGVKIQKSYPTNNDLFKFNSRNTRKRCGICPK